MAEAACTESDVSEGKNVQLFRVRMRGICKQIVDGMSADRFKQIYADVLSNKDSRHAKRLLKIWQEKAVDVIMKDLENAIKDSEMNEKLEARSRILAESQPCNGTTWRPPGNVAQHMRALDMQEKLHRKAELEALLEKKEASVQQLKLEVQTARHELLVVDNVIDTDMEKLCFENSAKKALQEALNSVMETDDRDLM